MVLGFTIFIASCSGDDIADLKEYSAKVKARQRGAIDPLPAITTVEPYRFQSVGLHDPFVRSEKTGDRSDMAVPNGIRPDLERNKEDLESYELDTLRMVGTVDLHGDFWGLIKAVDGTIHRVRAGNYMGRNFGKVVRVKEDRVELIEIIPDNVGAWQERPAALDLAEISAAGAKNGGMK